jgi:hypothetical protein
LPLLSCAGWAGGRTPLPTVRLKVGETVTVVNGDTGTHLILATANPTLSIDGLGVTGKRVGTGTVTVTGWFCTPVADIQPKTCPLMRVNVVS